MSPPQETKCKKDEIKDDDSVIDRCWKPQYKGDSRKWIIRDGSHKQPRDHLCSTMRDSFIYPEHEHKESEFVGKRRALLMQKFYDEASEEVNHERNAPPPIEEYCTEYDSNYYVEGFHPVEQPHGNSPELYQKYPLYAPVIPTTYYSFNLKKNPKPFLCGLTAITDPKSPFKRSSGITKHHSEELLENEDSNRSDREYSYKYSSASQSSSTSSDGSEELKSDS